MVITLCTYVPCLLPLASGIGSTYRQHPVFAIKNDRLYLALVEGYSGDHDQDDGDDVCKELYYLLPFVKLGVSVAEASSNEQPQPYQPLRPGQLAKSQFSLSVLANVDVRDLCVRGLGYERRLFLRRCPLPRCFLPLLLCSSLFYTSLHGP